MLRARELATLNDVYSLALQEEQILNYTKGRNSNHSNQPYYTYCKLNDHSTQQCRKKPKIPQHTPTQIYTYGPRNFATRNTYPNPSHNANFGHTNTLNPPPYNNGRHSSGFNTNTSTPRYEGNGNQINLPPSYPLPSSSGSNNFRRPFFDNRKPSFNNPRVNNVQSDSLNCEQSLMTNAPSLDDPDLQLQAAFKDFQNNLHL